MHIKRAKFKQLTRRFRLEPNVRFRDPGVLCGVRPLVFGVVVVAAVAAAQLDDIAGRLGVSTVDAEDDDVAT